ncbi:hypothetical protein DKP76_13600 [Falsochrobactrum shanghaiense]|uniref:Uncharacterized protein n=1 Tax=Falsochrobactrum shanghaiense TaxID=2201899 RepID=A0A316J5W5_9HYPH|nr:hypothetical protein [Falsochrobactrum shanghaiense]PWL17064.1 hypothetical protein DKP76_13600 [Falsochrobactrum shanghaiense]
MIVLHRWQDQITGTGRGPVLRHFYVSLAHESQQKLYGFATNLAFLRLYVAKMADFILCLYA